MRITSQKVFKGLDEGLKLGNDLGFASEMSNFRVTDEGSLECRKAIEEIYSDEYGSIRGIWCGTVAGKEAMVFTAEGRVYRADPKVIPLNPILIGEIAVGDTMMFGFGDLLYIKVGTYYYKYDGDGLRDVEGYTPLVALSCTPNGEGELFEQINLISDNRRQLFSCDGEAKDYYLAEKEIDGIISVTVDGETYSDYSLGETKDYVHFDTAPPEGLNNMEITYRKEDPDQSKTRIFGCTRVMKFGGNSDGRLFLWGNDSYPNYRFHSDLANGVPSAEYFPVNAFTIIGNSRINCIVQQYNRMLIFNEHEAYYSYCELRDDGLGNTYSSFPVFNLNGTKGAIIQSDGCIMDNRPVTLCEDGLNAWESTSLPDEKNAVCISKSIDQSILKLINQDKGNIKYFDFQANRELYFIWNEKAFVYNYGKSVWYAYNSFSGSNHTVFGENLYFSKGNTIYSFGNGSESPSSDVCLWESPFTVLNQNNGRTDILGFEADIQTEGQVTLLFELEKANGDISKRCFVFGEENNGFRRISFRPALKRAMPFRLRVTKSGSGSVSIHGFSIKTREKERSDRFGIY